MHKIDQVLFPELTKFVRVELPKIKNNKKTWNAFLHYGEFQARRFGDSVAVDALNWGSKPTLTVREIGSHYGEFLAQDAPNTIFIDTDVALRFEKDHNKLEAKQFMEATILHEMVHWGDHMDGKDQLPEEGNEFEKKAYGKVINQYW